MDPLLQLMTAVVSSTASLALVFGGLAGWFVRRLDRRFDAIDRRFDAIDRRFDGAAQETRQQYTELNTDFGRQNGELKAHMEKRFDETGRNIGALKADTEKRFDETGGNIGALKTDLQSQIRDFKADMRSQFDIAREERNRLAIRIDHLGERVEGLGDQLGDVRQSLGQLEGATFAAAVPEHPRGQKTA